jgi:hypothetical protein
LANIERMCSVLKISIFDSFLARDGTAAFLLDRDG